MNHFDKHLRFATGFLTVFCVALAVQALACAILFVHTADLLLHRGVTDAGGQYLVLLMANLLCDGIAFFLFTFLTAKVRREGRPSGKPQTRVLAVAGILMLIKTAASVMWPTFRLPYSEMLGAAEFIFPELDFQSMSYGLVFLALAGVFEYGRVLQEDSDQVI